MKDRKGKAEGHRTDEKEEGLLTDKIRGKDRVYVLFYANWCPFCQQFLPIFEAYSRGKPRECLRVDVDERPDICEEFSVEYYPSVILFKNGKVRKRLDSKPGIGLSKKQLKEFTEEG